MELTIDGNQIRTNPFVRKVLLNISWGLVDSLDDTPENPQTIHISLAPGSDVGISVDNQPIRTNPFVQKATRNIIMSIVNALDDIPENPKNITLFVSEK